MVHTVKLLLPEETYQALGTIGRRIGISRAAVAKIAVDRMLSEVQLSEGQDEHTT